MKNKEIKMSPETTTLLNILSKIEDLRSEYYDFLVDCYTEEEAEKIMYEKDVFSACYKEVEGHLRDIIKDRLNSTKKGQNLLVV